MFYAFVMWLDDYMDIIREYNEDSIKSLMESFQITLVSLAKNSVFGAEKLTVKTEFSDRNNWFKNIEWQLGLDREENRKRK